MDVPNNHGVCIRGDGKIAILLPPVAPMSKDEALIFASWIILLADPLGDRFEEIISAVENT